MGDVTKAFFELDQKIRPGHGDTDRIAFLTKKVPDKCRFWKSDKNICPRMTYDTLQELLDDLDVIECFEQPGRKPHIGEMTKKQMDLYTKLGIEVPT